MKKQFIVVSLVLILLIVGAKKAYDTPNKALTRELGEPVTVPYVNVTRYIGVWYEQAFIPFYFERGCSKTTATYSINDDGKTLKVNNTCIRNGRPTTSIGKAIPEDSTNAKLKVEFIQTLDIGGQYWVVRLGKDYEYSVVSSPNYQYLWILSRQQKLPEDVYNSIIADLKKENFPVEKLVKTEQ